MNAIHKINDNYIQNNKMKLNLYSIKSRLLYWMNIFSIFDLSKHEIMLSKGSNNIYIILIIHSYHIYDIYLYRTKTVLNPNIFSHFPFDRIKLCQEYNKIYWKFLSNHISPIGVKKPYRIYSFSYNSCISFQLCFTLFIIKK